MKKIMGIVLLATVASILAGCSSNYVLQTKSGEMIITKGKPQTDKSTGLVTYNDAGGNEHQINRDQIREIVEK